jgi:hypothetical protein
VITLSCEDLEILVASDSDNTPAELFGAEHLLTEDSILQEVLSELTLRLMLKLALMYFYNTKTVFYYLACLPLLDKEE